MSKEIVTLKEYLEALRTADQRALNIKAEADKDALILAREIQTYKDQQHNNILSQLNQERGEYVTLALYNQRHDELEKKLIEIDKHAAENSGFYVSKEELSSSTKSIEASIKPLAEFVASQHGRNSGVIDARTIVFTVITLVISASAVFVSLVAAILFVIFK